MEKYTLPIPTFQSFTNTQDALAYIARLPEKPLFIKASGLAAGKGAIRANTKEEAKQAIKEMKKFGSAGKTFVIEECMTGEEFSLFALCDGKNYKIIAAAQDHKNVYEADQGPNTGGMGCVSPTSAVTPKILKEVEEKILKPFMIGMKHEGRAYQGILYLGGMIDESRPAGKQVRIIEFNARWGDPEVEVIVPSIKNDYIDIIQAVALEQLEKTPIKLDDKVRISIAGCARGYPDDYSSVKGKRIFNLEKAAKLPGITIFGAGIAKQGKYWVVNGGRIFHLVAVGATITQARFRANAAMSMIYIEGNNLHYRTDIGWREQQRNYK